jgi:hypothetical protein
MTEMVEIMQNTGSVPFSVRDLSVLRFWYLQGVLEPTSERDLGATVHSKLLPSRMILISGHFCLLIGTL